MFNSKWSYSPLVEQIDGDSKVQTKLFKRFIYIDQKPISIVETSFVYLENSKGDESQKDINLIAQKIKKSLGLKLKINKNDSNLEISGPVEKLNRFYKIELLKKNNYFIVVTSTIRLGLKEKLIGEVRELHNLLLTYEGKIGDTQTKKTSWFKFPFFIEEVEAQGLGLNFNNLFGGSNLTTPPGGSNSGGAGGSLFNFTGLTSSVQELNTTVNGLNTTLGTTNGNWATSNNQMGNLNTTWGNTNLRLGDSNSNWSGTNGRIGDLNTSWTGTNIRLGDANSNWNNTNQQIGTLNQNLAETNTQFDKANQTAAAMADQYKSMNTNWAESNKLLAKALDPNHMAKVAFYTAAGAALGGIAINLAVQGVSAGISFLTELFTGAKEKKLEWDDFEKAMQVWDASFNDLVKYEQVVDNLIGAFDFFEGKTLGNDYLKQLGMAVRDMKFDRDLFTEKFKDQNMDIACRKIYHDAADELDSKIKDYEKIIAFASQNNLSITNGANYFCQQLKELQRKIISAETQMQDLRLKILVAENQYYGKQSDAIEKRDEDLKKVNRRIGSTLEEKKEYDNLIKERAQKAIEQSRIDWLQACRDGKNEEGLKAKKTALESFFLFRHFKTSALCEESYAKVAEEIKKRTTQSIEQLASEDEARKKLVLRPNAAVELRLSEEQMNWMARIHMDAYCYQFAHVEVEKVPTKCKEYPEMLYSLNLSKGYEKAKAAYDNKCQSKYVDGLKRMAK
jgi:hypothetical protein